MAGELGTTNLLLGVMAAVSVLEALLALAVAIAGFVMYRRVMTAVDGLERRQLAPTMARMNAILDDVKGVTTTVKAETARVDSAIRSTLERVDDTADRVRYNVKSKASRIVGVIRGVRVAIESLLTDRDRRAQEHY
ncbi:MAG TPA: hypothetical protein VGY48_12150 [Vicinamibacterales bacterium]|jgi:hypothetical protein|nr:hypothetical protein [Vicinamibacterales bacterium]